MCWGRGRSEDGESVGERERLLDHGKNNDDDGERWDSDEETEFEEEQEEDERLMGAKQDGKIRVAEGNKRWKGVLRGVRNCSRWS